MGRESGHNRGRSRSRKEGPTMLEKLTTVFRKPKRDYISGMWHNLLERMPRKGIWRKQRRNWSNRFKSSWKPIAKWLKRSK